MRSHSSVRIYKNWCKKCEICIAFCPKKVLEIDQEGYPVLIDDERCNACGLCELRCPDYAIAVDHEES